MQKCMSRDPPCVGKYRAIMTTTDRDRISGDADVPDSKRYQAITRVRSRIEELETDVDLLEDHNPDLLDELRQVVCRDSVTDLIFTPLGSKNVSYGPSQRGDAAYVLRVGTGDGTVEIHLDEDQMYELWTEVKHTPWPERAEDDGEVGRLRGEVVERIMGADEEMLTDVLETIDPHRTER